MIEKEKFVNYTLDEDKKEGVKVTSLKLNLDDQALLKKCQEVLNQKKEGTAIKSLLYLGAKVLLEEKTLFILDTVFKNKRNNKRNGILEFE